MPAVWVSNPELKEYHYNYLEENKEDPSKEAISCINIRERYVHLGRIPLIKLRSICHYEIDLVSDFVGS